MSAFRRMIGRELPCTLAHLLDLPLPPHDAQIHEELHEFAHATGDPDTLYRLALSHLAAEQLGLARTLFRTLRRRKSHTHRARLALAAIDDLLGQHIEAAAHLDMLLAEHPASPDDSDRYRLLCAAGFCLERSGDWNHAKARYVAALSAQPTDLFAHHRLVAIHLAHGEHAEAAAYLRDILRHSPQEMSARICLAHLMQASGHHAEAAWEYEQALCLQPDGWEMPLDAAMEGMGDDADAIDYLEKLVGTQPHFPDLRLRLANLYSRCGDDEAATAAFEQALELHPEYLEGHIAVARHELRMGRTAAAVDHFRQALAINDQNIEAYAGLSAASRSAGRLRHADDILASAARLATNSALLTAQLGLLSIDDENHRFLDESALNTITRRCEEALDANPGATDLRLRHGLLCQLLKRHDDALAAFRRVILEEPACNEAWLHLAMLWAAMGKSADADVAIRNALAPERISEELHYRLALIYCGELEFDLSAEQLEDSDADASNRIVSAIEQMHLTGLCRPLPQRHAPERAS